MAENSRPGIDALTVIFLGLTVVLAGIHLYLALVHPAVTGAQRWQFALIAAAFLVGVLARLSNYWHSLLYLLGAAFALALGVIWLLGDSEPFTIGVLTGVVATAFVVLALYLFVREESRAVSS